MLTLARTDALLTREELARRSGLSLEYLRKLEAGKFPITDSALVRLSRGLGCTTEALEARLRPLACPRIDEKHSTSPPIAKTTGW